MKLDASSVVPLYHQLKEILREMLKNGAWAEGQEIPSERLLMEAYGVSRATVRQALGELAREGLIIRKQGRGTFSSKAKIAQNLIGEPSFVRQVSEQGFEPSSTLIEASVEADTPEHIAKVLALTTLRQTFRLCRIRLVDDEPLALETLYIPRHLAPNLLGQDLQTLAVMEYLQAQGNFSLTHSATSIEPVLTNEFEAAQLGVQAGMPALSVERTFYADSVPFCLQKRVIRGDRSKFLLTVYHNSPTGEVVKVGLEVRQPGQPQSV